MKIIDVLKKILGIKPNQEQLYLPVSQENDETHKFRQNCRIQQQLPNNPKEPTLEECMDEFIKQYSLFQGLIIIYLVLQMNIVLMWKKE